MIKITKSIFKIKMYYHFLFYNYIITICFRLILFIIVKISKSLKNNVYIFISFNMFTNNLITYCN